jgi:hypothetical protein
VVAALVVITIPTQALAAADTTPPNPPVITGPSGRVPSTSADISVTPDDPKDLVYCLVDGIDVNCPGSWTISDLDQGPHGVEAYSEDAAGNTSTVVSIYWVVDTVGPVPTVVTPTSLTNAATVTFNENVTGVSANSVTIISASGDPVAVSRSCVTNTLEATPCGGSSVRKVYLTPDDRWVLGESYTVTVNDVGAVTVADTLGNKASQTTGNFNAATSTEELGTTQTWRSVSNAKALGGSFKVDRRAGASVTYGFSGGSLTWVTNTGPTYGQAELFVDGVSRGAFNNYSAKRRFGVQRVVTGLGSGQHTAEVRVLGKKGNRAGTDQQVAVDAFVTQAGTDASPSLTQRWQRVYAASASNGYYSIGDLAKASATTTFAGASISLTTALGPKFGEVGLYVDGALETTDDLYSPSLSFGHQVTVSGLSPGQHTLEIRVLGSKNPASGGTGVVLDAVSTG